MNRLVLLLAQIDVRPDDFDVPKNPLTQASITTALQIVFGVAGGVALIIVMLGAFQYVISRGEPQSTAKAKDTILYALVGLVICITAFSIVTFVVGKV